VSLTRNNASRFSEFIVALFESGKCAVFHRASHQSVFLNKSEDEQIKSIFFNRINQSVIVVSVTKKDDFNSLKCRSVSLALIQQAFAQEAPLSLGKRSHSEKEDERRPVLLMKGALKGQKLFREFSLRWPDFVEFDELNSKIITKHSQEESYRVWCLGSYQLQFVIKEQSVAEFKICNGIMLLLHHYADESTLPMTLLKVNSGQPLLRFKFQRVHREIEFLEQFNEKIMLKTAGQDLLIFDARTSTKLSVPGFNAPEAFIFLYEHEKILTLKDGKVQLWTSRGEMVCDFGGRVLCTRALSPMEVAAQSASSPSAQGKSVDPDYIVSVSQSKKYLFSFMMKTCSDVPWSGPVDQSAYCFSACCS
jgi:hypothetical protein